jgi:glucose-6-phosphate 1-dehydrogenase
MQILTMVAMEAPTSLQADEIRNRKADVLKDTPYNSGRGKTLHR